MHVAIKIVSLRRARHSRWLLLFIELAILFLLSCLAVFIVTSCGKSEGYLRRLLGSSYASIEVVQAGHTWSILFGDTCYAWHLQLPAGEHTLPPSFVASDESDLQFALQSIESILGISLDGVDTTQLNVYRGGSEREHVYLVPVFQTRSLYVFVFTN